MTDIRTRRAGLICIAATVNDHLDISTTWAFTREGARRRLTRRLLVEATDPATLRSAGWG
jgi:hypothetical protein